MARGEVEKLVARYGGIVTEKARFTIEPGEAFALLGPSGAGKTTIRILLTLLPPTSKTVRVARCGAARFSDPVRRIVGSVPSPRSADSTLTEYQDLLVESMLRRMPRRERERVIDEVLRLVDLEETAERLVRT